MLTPIVTAELKNHIGKEADIENTNGTKFARRRLTEIKDEKAFLVFEEENTRRVLSGLFIELKNIIKVKLDSNDSILKIKTKS